MTQLIRNSFTQLDGLGVGDIAALETIIIIILHKSCRNLTHREKEREKTNETYLLDKYYNDKSLLSYTNIEYFSRVRKHIFS